MNRLLFMSVMPLLFATCLHSMEKTAIIDVPLLTQGFSSLSGKKDLTVVDVGQSVTNPGRLECYILEDLVEYPGYYYHSATCEIEEAVFQAAVVDQKYTLRCGTVSMEAVKKSYGTVCKRIVKDDLSSFCKVVLAGSVIAVLFQLKYIYMTT